MRTSSVANETIKNYGVNIKRPRGFEQDNHFSRRNVKFFCVINPIHVDISRPIKHLDLSSGSICKLEHEIYRHAE